MSNKILTEEIMGWKMWEHGISDSRLTIVSQAESKIQNNGRHRIMLRCLCSCGNEKVLERDNVLYGRVKSCGCYKREYLHESKSTHKGHGEKLYRVWASMKARCYNEHEKAHTDYGARGITVCDKWKDNYSAFREWAKSTGYDENAPKGTYTIERKDVNKGYSPDNCCWIPRAEQNKNTRKTIKVEYNGKIYLLHDLAKELNVKYTTLYYRIKYSSLSEDKIFHKGTLRKVQYA